MIDAVAQDFPQPCRLPILAASILPPALFYIGCRIGLLVAGTRVMNGNDTVSREKEGQR